MPKYMYQPLDKPASNFRLLRISKDSVTHQPHCSLQNYSLINCPEYTALSYTWGRPTPIHSVPVEGANLNVRQNLFDFLHAYTTEPWGMNAIGKPAFYWIDQICINQEDLAERSDQVRIMDKIYKQAKMVLVWLGCDPKTMEAARRVRDEQDDDEWAITTLLAHPYFSRIWIVQEISLSLELPLIVCGGIELNWLRVCFAAQHARRILSSPVLYLMNEGLRPTYDIHRGSRTLQQCIGSYCGGNSHDPRDKVYGLLGLTPERWRVCVDYTKEVLEVYFDAVAALFEELFDLENSEFLYPKRLTDSANSMEYCNTLFGLAIAMGLPLRHHYGLEPFLRYCQDEYLTTKIRNVRYTYTGRIYNRVQALSSSQENLVPEEEVEVSWGSITATRRNPLMRDIIPEMGLQLASTTVKSIAGQSGDSMPVSDRWWCKHNGEIRYFDCFDPSDGLSDLYQWLFR